jgi:signal peptidase II
MNLKFLFNPFKLSKEEIKSYLQNRITPTLIILTIILVLDQAAKQYIRNHLYFGSNYKYLFNIVTIERVNNTGAFLSLGDTLNVPFKAIFLGFIPLLVMLVGLLFILLAKNIEKTNLFGFVLVLAGGIGNLIDRFIYKSVTDFLFLKLGFLQTGVFNIADMAIMGGMITILIHSFLKERNAKRHLDN